MKDERDNPIRRSRAMQATLATILAMYGLGRRSPPARLFRPKAESARRVAQAARKRELRRQRNLRDAANLQFKEKVHTP